MMTDYRCSTILLAETEVTLERIFIGSTRHSGLRLPAAAESRWLVRSSAKNYRITHGLLALTDETLNSTLWSHVVPLTWLADLFTEPIDNVSVGDTGINKRRASIDTCRVNDEPWRQSIKKSVQCPCTISQVSEASFLPILPSHILVFLPSLISLYSPQ
ncbi:unnamed protein product [Protopolystoma xenopodis]|uniref:Uncharacterized protein n=1 Tax=Protopolystoma xenopodis TaxID=117903 RepID=A0A3S5FFU2_9PLAT|nr:unnamed protein product [Protopolystoma xenopodis]